MNIRECDIPNIKKIGIYCITNLVNGKKYIGKVGRKYGFKKRWNIHKNELNRKVHNNLHFQNSWNKYGEDSFEFSILEVVDVIEDIKKLNKILNEREQYWIRYYDTFNSDNGYNLTKGGDGVLGIIPWDKGLTKETDDRIKNLTKKAGTTIHNLYLSGKIKHWALNIKGLDNPNTGKKRTKEQKENQSKSAKEAFKLGKRKIHNKGKTKENYQPLQVVSEKVSKTMIEKGTTRGKNSPSAKPIIQLTLDNKIIREYDYIKQVEDYGFKHPSVRRALKRKNNIYRGFKWILK